MKPVSGSSSRPSSPVESSSTQATKPKVEVRPGLVKAMGKQLLDQGLFVGGHRPAPGQKAGESLTGSVKGQSAFTKTKASTEDAQKMKTTPPSSPTSGKPAVPPKPTTLQKPVPMPRVGKAAVGGATGGGSSAAGLGRKPAIKARTGVKAEGLQRSNSLDGTGSKKDTAALKRSNSVGDVSTEKTDKSDKASKADKKPSIHQERMQKLKDAFRNFFKAIKNALLAPRRLYLHAQALKEGQRRVLEDVKGRNNLQATTILNPGEQLETEGGNVFLGQLNSIFHFEDTIKRYDAKADKIHQLLLTGDETKVSQAASLAVSNVQDLQEVSDKVLAFYKDSGSEAGSDEDLATARCLGMVKARLDFMTELFTV